MTAKAKTEATVRALIITGVGLNCEQETAAAFEAAGAAAEPAHLNGLLRGERRLGEFHILALIGGFSFGDHLGSGTVLMRVSGFFRSGEGAAEMTNPGRNGHYIPLRSPAAGQQKKGKKQLRGTGGAVTGRCRKNFFRRPIRENPIVGPAQRRVRKMEPAVFREHLPNNNFSLDAFFA